MVISKDIRLSRSLWHSTSDYYSQFFSDATYYQVFIVSLAIGIMYDERVETKASSDEDPITITRNVLTTRDNGILDLMFQTAIVSTDTEDLSEDERLELAFGESEESFNKFQFLIEFANFGVTKLNELIGGSEIETMDNLNTFMRKSIEGKNYEIRTVSKSAYSDQDIEEAFSSLEG